MLVSLVTMRHEKWADEAQAWLLVRNLDLRTLWFHELRYEGSPGLWHSILWVAQRVFHMPYSGLGAIGVVCAFAGVALILWRAPFPKPLVWLLPFSYFIIYQYGVLARPYTLLCLLAFAAAVLFKDQQHPERITIALALLANLSAHGILMTMCIGGAYLLRGVLQWNSFDGAVRKKYLLSTAFMALLFIFLFFVLKPPPDVEAIYRHRRTLDEFVVRTWIGVNGAFFDVSALTVVWLVLLGAWCHMRTGWGKWLPVAMILALGAFYGFYGGPHHQGTIFIGAVAGLWIAWPTPAERDEFGIRQRQTHVVLMTFFGCLLVYQVWNATVALRNDYRYPYCGAKETAVYLKSVGADKQRILGVGYGFVAVQAYFDHNILINRPTEYFHHAIPLIGINLNDDVMEEYRPDYVVLDSWFEPDEDLRMFRMFMAVHGYSLAHASNGYSFFKRGFNQRQVYFIFRRDGLK